MQKITSIEVIGDRETLDISVDGDHLFFANGVLTHNSGHNNSDVDMDNVAESFGLNATVDFLAALISNENLEQSDQMMVKQLKNRYRDKGKDTKFIIGVKKKFMKLFDVEQSAQTGIVGAAQVATTNTLPVNTTSENPKPIDSGFFSKKKSNSFDGFKL